MSSQAEQGKGPRLTWKQAVKWADESPAYLSRLTGVHVQTVWRWKTHGIPMGWRYYISELMGRVRVEK